MLKLLPTPIGNIADISFRVVEAISQANIFLCEDTRVTKKLINLLSERYNISTQDGAEFYSLHSHNEDAFLSKITPDFFDANVIYVSDAGMPAISDPGAKLVAYCQRHGVEYDVYTGANALITAYAASGFDETMMLFYGFLPHKTNRKALLEKALNSGYNTIFYESPHRLIKLLEQIDSIDSSREIFLAKELTKKHQKYFRGVAKELILELGTTIKGEWVVVVNRADEQIQSGFITKSDILELSIPKKEQAKLLSKLTKKSVKECYSELL